MYACIRYTLNVKGPDLQVKLPELMYRSLAKKKHFENLIKMPL